MISILFGTFCLAYGLFTLFVRFKKANPDAVQSEGMKKDFGKLDIMREKFGYKLGTFIHVLFYTIIPLGLGISVLVLKFVYNVDVI